MRLFVAAALPESHRQRLVAVTQGLRQSRTRARWEPVEKLHFTLFFLGEVVPARVDRLLDALRRAIAGRPAIRLCLGDGGAFPSTSRARVLWVGPVDQEALVELQQPIAAAAAPFAERPDSKPFHAHLTLARCDPPWPALEVEQFARAVHGAAPEPFSISAIHLLESELLHGGSRYREVATLELGADVA